MSVLGHIRVVFINGYAYYILEVSNVNYYNNVRERSFSVTRYLILLNLVIFFPFREMLHYIVDF